jgi:hypothetical protein
MSKLLQVLVMLLCAAGIAKDYTPAEIKALLAAAEKGDARAQNEYGGAHYHVAMGGGGYVIREGLNGGPANPVEAAKWFLKASEQGYPDACFNIAHMYEEGVGVIKSGVEAEKWMKKYVETAESKNGAAQYNLALFYTKDRPDLPKNDKEAAVWFRVVAVMSVENAPWVDSSRQALGAYYANSKSAELSLTKAYAWWSVAAVSGDSGAAKKRDGIEQRLSASEVKEGRALAAEILKEIEVKKSGK